MSYRKIYESHHGSIPKEPDGRTYDIHHVDGNHSNNSINNLRAVSIQEHYDIHYEQEDWAACLIISDRMKISPEEISQLASLVQMKRVHDGTHHWLLRNRIQTRPITEWELKNPIDNTPLTEVQLSYLEFSRAMAIEAFRKKQQSLYQR